ncbi:MAG: Ribosomal large subunit pseudouridine synthase B [Alphaproteobacteria bacterium MarineAlpha2_Bin1]|nr:MAG: Ribosomal large subunit pseudouridine synthase B [Alphaproteobacteria bacterium MarineAlpha2_Bin1]
MHQKISQKIKKLEKITKKLSRVGIGSRRQIEKWIKEGRFDIDGKVLYDPAIRVDEKKKIYFDGKEIPKKEQTRLWKFYKPRGSLTSNYDQKGRSLIFDFLPKNIPRVISIGRLDYNTEGLILLTNDGELARKLEMPSSGFLRKYRVRVHGIIEKKKLEELSSGIIINSIKYKPIDVIFERQNKTNAWINMSLKEGKNREIRNIMEFFGWEVTRLIRLEFGPFKLGGLKEKTLMEVKYSSFSYLL